MSWEEMIKLLGENNVERLREAITNMLIQNLEESIQENWFILPNTWQNLLDSVYDEVLEREKAKYMEKLSAAIDMKLDSAIEAKLGVPAPVAEPVAKKKTAAKKPAKAKTTKAKAE